MRIDRSRRLYLLHFNQRTWHARESSMIIGQSLVGSQDPVRVPQLLDVNRIFWCQSAPFSFLMRFKLGPNASKRSPNAPGARCNAASAIQLRKSAVGATMTIGPPEGTSLPASAFSLSRRKTRDRKLQEPEGRRSPRPHISKTAGSKETGNPPRIFEHLLLAGLGPYTCNPKLA